VPGIAQASRPAPEEMSVRGTEGSTPQPNHLVGHGDAALGEEILGISKAQTETVVRRCRLAPEVRDLDRLDVPDTLEGVITGRVDAIDLAPQLTPKVASVIGRAFRRATLLAIHPMGVEDAELSAHLDDLVARDLVLVQTAGPDPEYLFKHIVLRDVVYGSCTA
jgi:hypothetical protein